MEGQVCQNFHWIALGNIPGQAVRCITLSMKRSSLQKLLVSRGMDALCGSKSAKWKRTGEAQHGGSGWGQVGKGWSVAHSLLFSYSNCGKTTNIWADCIHLHAAVNHFVMRGLKYAGMKLMSMKQKMDFGSHHNELYKRRRESLELTAILSGRNACH